MCKSEIEDGGGYLRAPIHIRTCNRLLKTIFHMVLEMEKTRLHFLFFEELRGQKNV